MVLKMLKFYAFGKKIFFKVDKIFNKNGQSLFREIAGFTKVVKIFYKMNNVLQNKYIRVVNTVMTFSYTVSKLLFQFLNER